MSEAAATISGGDSKSRRYHFLTDLCIRLVKQKPVGLAGGMIILVMCLTGIFADWLAPYGYNDINLFNVLAGPSPDHLLGCDNLGRDMLSRLIYGARISMLVSMIASTMSVVGSGLIGITSGYFGGKFDLIVQRWVDAVQAFPTLVLYLTAIAIVGPGLWQVIIVLGISGGIGGGRVFRSSVLSIKEAVYIESARVIGASNVRILLRHITPHVAPLLLISFSLSMGRMILAEASLSFLGFGIPPPYPSWGGMLSGSGREYMMVAPWMILYPGIALFLVVYGVNMFGDAIRDLLDPGMRGGTGSYKMRGKSNIRKPAGNDTPAEPSDR